MHVTTVIIRQGKYLNACSAHGNVLLGLLLLLHLGQQKLEKLVICSRRGCGSGSRSGGDRVSMLIYGHRSRGCKVLALECHDVGDGGEREEVFKR